MSRIPENITFITLPKMLAQFHHLPEHVPVHVSRAEDAKHKGYPFGEDVQAMEEMLAADSQVPGSYLYRLFIAKWPKWRQAERLLSAGRLAEAIQGLVGILEIDPECPLTCFQLGFCFRVTGELEKSESFYKQALRMAPDAGWIHSNLGRTYQVMGDEGRAAEAYWMALEKLPNDLFVLEQLEALGEIVPLPALGNPSPEKSYVKRTEYEKITREEMATFQSAADFLAAGWKALRARLWDVAGECFEKARNLSAQDRQTDEAELGLGVLFFNMGKWHEAERWIRGYMDRHPDSAAAHFHLFKVYLALREEDASSENRAWEEICTAASLAPHDMDILRQLFAFFEKTGREEEGLAVLKALAVDHPDSPIPLLLQAQYHDEKGDWAQAEPLLQEALKRDPGNEAVLVYYSAALGKSGQAEKAVDLLRSKRGSLTFSLTVNLALALRQSGKTREALKVLEEFKENKDAPALDRMRAEVLWREFGKDAAS